MCKDEANSRESQQVFAPTQGQDQISLTSNSIISAESRRVPAIQKTMFTCEDDELHVEINKANRVGVRSGFKAKS